MHTPWQMGMNKNQPKMYLYRFRQYVKMTVSVRVLPAGLDNPLIFSVRGDKKYLQLKSGWRGRYIKISPLFSEYYSYQPPTA